MGLSFEVRIHPAGFISGVPAKASRRAGGEVNGSETGEEPERRSRQ